MTPKVSTAMSSNSYRASMFAYFSILQEAASSATAPASWTALVTYESANKHVTVTSQHNDLPLCQRMRVRPSGHLPSVRYNPTGSFVMGAPAEEKPRPYLERLFLRDQCLIGHGTNVVKNLPQRQTD